MIIKLPDAPARHDVAWARSIKLEIEKAFQRVFEYARLPSGGSAGAVLSKVSARDYDVRWVAPSTVAGLTAAATAGAGARSLVTDATVTTFASAVVGGGANSVPVYSDGAAWKIG